MNTLKYNHLIRKSIIKLLSMQILRTWNITIWVGKFIKNGDPLHNIRVANHKSQSKLTIIIVGFH